MSPRGRSGSARGHRRSNAVRRWPRGARRQFVRLLLPVCALAAGCEQIEKIEDSLRDLTPHEAYLESLVAAGLDETALVRDWAAAGLGALENPLALEVPFEERGHITPEDPLAVAYRVHIPRGRNLAFRVSLDAEADTRLFIDLFRVPENESDPLRPVFSSDSLAHTFEHEDPWRAGDYILRIQPELLRGGSYRVTVGQEAAFAFPVEGHSPRSILSGFGAPRDGGRRVHHGVDIFARRGTPVLSASDGRTERVRTTRLGGKVVWVVASDNTRFYYAHLDSQHVGSGEWVAKGDTVGFVGNTGNARTTPPHLHFGIYRPREGQDGSNWRRRSPIDPAPLLVPPPTRRPELTADLSLLGEEVRVVDDGIRLRVGPGARAPILAELAADTPLQVLAATADRFRVRLPDGAEGYVAARLIRPDTLATTRTQDQQQDDFP